jgi:hypothetical protein
MGSIKPWEKIVAEKRALRDHALKPYLVDDLDKRPPRIDNVADRTRIDSDPLVQKITDIDSIAELHEQLGKGHFTAEDVALAYIKRFELYSLRGLSYT